jgi:uncharacterized membrane protein
MPPLKGLHALVHEPEPLQLKVYRVNHPLQASVEVDAPMDLVYAKLIDLKGRKEILSGVTDVKIQDENHNRINKLGTVHECIREQPQGLVMTTGVESGESRIVFTETSLTKPFSFDYIVEKTGEKSCRLTFSAHIVMNAASRVMFNLLMRKKMSASFDESLQKVKETCEQFYRQEKQPVVS